MPKSKLKSNDHISIEDRNNPQDFRCIQTQSIQQIQNSQKQLLEIQESNKETLEVMNSSLDRIYKLYEKNDKRLNDGDKRFEKITEFMIEKKYANGNLEKDNHDLKEDMKDGTDRFTKIENKVTTLEINYTNLLNSNQTIINILKSILVAAAIGIGTYVISVIAHLLML